MPDGADANTEPTPIRRVGRGVLALAGVLVAYYAVPVGRMPSSWDIVLAALGLVAGLAALVWVTVRQVRLLAAGRGGDARARLDVLVLVVVVVVPLFALAYYGLERGDADQFADLETKADALYFSLSTLATVGYGDVHATGQLARVIVSLQIVVDVVFVATVASLLTSELRARVAERAAAGHGPGAPPSPSAPEATGDEAGAGGT